MHFSLPCFIPPGASGVLFISLKLTARWSAVIDKGHYCSVCLSAFAVARTEFPFITIPTRMWRRWNNYLCAICSQIHANLIISKWPHCCISTEPQMITSGSGDCGPCFLRQPHSGFSLPFQQIFISIYSSLRFYIQIYDDISAAYLTCCNSDRRYIVIF